MAPSTASFNGSQDNHSSNTTNKQQESYTTMDQSDVEAIGAHCQFEYCHQLDFLPFRCESCRGTYCLNHRTESSHSCPKAGLWARERSSRLNPPSSTTTSSASTTTSSSSLSKSQKCSSQECKTLINTPRSIGVQCPTCQREYCLKHRFRDEHGCEKLVPLNVGRLAPGNPVSSSSSSTEKAKVALTRLRNWGRDKHVSQNRTTSGATSSSTGGGGGGGSGKTISTTITNWTTTKKSPSTTSAAARINALNDLKKNAKGDIKIPIQKRIYIHVEASSETPPTLTTSSPATNGTPTTNNKNPQEKERDIKKENLFFDKTWKIGRVLDSAAKYMQVMNLNNSGKTEEEKLRVYHVEGGRVLEFSEILGEAVAEGNTIVLLRGVGAG